MHRVPPRPVRRRASSADRGSKTERDRAVSSARRGPSDMASRVKTRSGGERAGVEVRPDELAGIVGPDDECVDDGPQRPHGDDRHGDETEHHLNRHEGLSGPTQRRKFAGSVSDQRHRSGQNDACGEHEQRSTDRRRLGECVDRSGASGTGDVHAGQHQCKGSDHGTSGGCSEQCCAPSGRSRVQARP